VSVLVVHRHHNPAKRDEARVLLLGALRECAAEHPTGDGLASKRGSAARARNRARRAPRPSDRRS
jgi:hypothetical protein